MSTNLKKKAKTDKNGGGSDFDTLRRYILECPHLSSDSAAVKAAIAGLDQELKRRDRDAKLQRKFATSCGVDNSTSAVPTSKQRTVATEDDELMKEWQDVGAAGDDNSSSKKQSACLSESNNSVDSYYDDEVEIIDVNGTTSVLGKHLSSIVISTIAEFHGKAKSPLAAIAMALHAAMRSEVLGFACTGVPDAKGGGGGGFAAPIRELPKTQFLPKDWDKLATNAPTKAKEDPSVTLRYRKNGMGSIHLKVEQQSQQQQQQENQQVSIRVQIVPANSQEPSNESLLFPLDQHINLDSWNAALRVCSSLPPALHYKALSVLLTNFTKTFDLGHVNEDLASAVAAAENVAAAEKHTIPTMGADTTLPPAAPAEAAAASPSPLAGFAQPCNRQQQQQQQNDPFHINPPVGFFPNPNPGLNPVVGGGDFAGDLAPGGLTNPLIFNNGPSLGSNMGPNHPMFGGVNRIGGNPGEGGMPRPRFDPFGPPGGPQEINPNFPGRGNRLGGKNMRPPPGGFGEPDNDLLRPPDNDLMFS